MRSKVAEEVRAAQRAEEAAMTPDERLELALELGQQAVEMFCAAYGLTAEQAHAELDRRSQLSRRRSRCANPSDAG